MAKANLLPRKEFEIILDDGQVIAGKYGTWAIKRFCDKRGIKLSQLNEILSGDLSFDDIVEILLCAVEYNCRLKNLPFNFSDIDVCGWIDELGGLLGEEYLKLAAHAGSSDEKKSPVNQQTSTTSSVHFSEPVGA